LGGVGIVSREMAVWGRRGGGGETCLNSAAGSRRGEEYRGRCPGGGGCRATALAPPFPPPVLGAGEAAAAMVSKDPLRFARPASFELTETSAHPHVK
jgi:hypothetical protein